VPGINGREHKEIPFKSLALVIEARMLEIMDMIQHEIRKYTNADREKNKLMAGIVFTGGGAQMTNLRELVKLKTGMDVRIGKPCYISEDSPKEIIHPKYSTAAGLIMCGFDSLDCENKAEEIEEVRMERVNQEVEASAPASNSDISGTQFPTGEVFQSQSVSQSVMKFISDVVNSGKNSGKI
jgi:cell division protein FtsA